MMDFFISFLDLAVSPAMVFLGLLPLFGLILAGAAVIAVIVIIILAVKKSDKKKAENAEKPDPDDGKAGDE